jgi:hypothetical protein
MLVKPHQRAWTEAEPFEEPTAAARCPRIRNRLPDSASFRAVGSWAALGRASVRDCPRSTLRGSGDPTCAWQYLEPFGGFLTWRTTDVRSAGSMGSLTPNRPRSVTVVRTDGGPGMPDAAADDENRTSL